MKKQYRTCFLIIGNTSSALPAYLAAHDYDYIVLKDILRAKSPEKRFKRRAVCDFSTRESIIKAVDTIKRKIDGVVCTYENYALPAAWVAEHLSLPGMPIDSMEACTDKFLMRQRFALSPEKISPDFELVNNEEDVINFAKKHSFPLILKPANLAKSLLVTKNHDLEELLENYQRTTTQIESVYSKYAPNRTPRIVIEEFLEGPVHSVDAFVDEEGEPFVLAQVVDYQTGYDIGFDDNFHYSRLLPSKLSQEDQAAVRHCAELGIKSLGMRSSPAHVEVIMTKEGPRIVEIGARNGGYRPRMHKLANGVDITGAALAIATGQKPQVDSSKNHPCAVIELFPKTPGFFQGIANQATLEKLPSFDALRIKVELDDFVGKSADGYKMCAVLVLHHADQAQFDQDLKFVNQNVEVKTALDSKLSN